MTGPTATSGLSPLDQIRLTEGEITRRLITAREASERAIAEARAHSALLKKQAHDSGRRAGEFRLKESVAKAEEEACAIVAVAQTRASDLRRKGQARMEQAIVEGIGIILGLKGGDEEHEC